MVAGTGDFTVLVVLNKLLSEFKHLKNTHLGQH